MAEQEESARVLVDVYGGLYQLGNKDALQKLLGLFEDPDHHVKCAILHTLEEMIDGEDLPIIRQFIENIDTSVLDYAVADTVRQVKDRIGAHDIAGGR